MTGQAAPDLPDFPTDWTPVERLAAYREALRMGGTHSEDWGLQRPEDWEQYLAGAHRTAERSRRYMTEALQRNGRDFSVPLHPLPGDDESPFL